MVTGELIIEEARPPFWVNSSGLPSAYNGLDYSTMRLRLRYAVDTDVLGEDLADKWVRLTLGGLLAQLMLCSRCLLVLLMMMKYVPLLPGMFETLRGEVSVAVVARL